MSKKNTSVTLNGEIDGDMIRVEIPRSLISASDVLVEEGGGEQSKITPPFSRPDVFYHSADFATVIWGQCRWTFTKSQRVVVQELVDAWRNGLPGLSVHQLLRAANSDAAGVYVLFRLPGGGYHPAWKTMIQESRVASDVEGGAAAAGIYRFVPPIAT
jgi:hypothetical protein